MKYVHIWAMNNVLKTEQQTMRLVSPMGKGIAMALVSFSD